MNQFSRCEEQDSEVKEKHITNSFAE